MAAAGAEPVRGDAVRGNLAALACMLLWATNFPVADALLKTWSPLAVTVARLAIGGAFILLVALAVGQVGPVRRLFAVPAVHLAAVFQILSTFPFMYGQTKVDPVVAAVIVSSMPVVSIILGLITGEERLTLRFVLAIALAVVGGIVTSWPEPGASAADASLIGALAIIAGMTAYVLYTNVLVSTLRSEPDIAKSAVCMIVAAAMATLAAAIALPTGLAPVVAEASSRSIMLALWLGVVIVGASTVLWMWAGRHVGITIAAMHHNLVPFYVILMGSAVGTPVTTQHVVGALLVIAGAVLAQMPLQWLLTPRRS